MLVKSLKFRQKIVLLALALVIAVQAVTLFFVLTVIQRDSANSMRQSVSLAGAVFDEYVSSRSEQLQTAAAVLASDFGFREAIATAEPDTIRSMLRNHTARIDADLGLLLDPLGHVISSTTDNTSDDIFMNEVEQASAMLAEGSNAVVIISGRAFQVIGATIRAPLPIARVLIGFEIDATLVSHLRSITGLDITFLGTSDATQRVFASTLPAGEQAAALENLSLARPDSSAGGEQPQSSETHVSLVRSFAFGDEPLYAVLQLSVATAEQSYRNIQRILLAITVASIIAALIGSVLVGRMVTRPVDKLTSVVRRMSKGDLSERLDLHTNDEFGELADGFNSMQAAIADRQQQIVQAANHDSLTGLPNRESILRTLTDAMQRGQAVAAADLSIVRLNKLIAALGHELSDKMIRKIADVMKSSLDSRHILGCLGRDEFLIVFLDVSSPDIERTVNMLGRVLEAEVRVDGTSYSLQLRAGIASSSENLRSAAAMLYAASIARMEAEELRETVVHYRQGQEERAVRQTRLLGEFFDATERDELEIFFQPKVYCSSGEVCGAEALVRWRHPEYGLLPPSEFVETIEKAGSISRLTRWMLRRALQECRGWLDDGFDLGVAVNISADDLLDENLPYFLLDQISTYRIKASYLTLEITESAIMHNLSKALSVIQCIHELGFRLSIDDFGTGHSSLAQLRRLPANELKIDRSFLKDMEDSRDVSIVLATIEMASGLGLDVCAEGIESLALLPTLDGMGARYGQGYAISRPMPSGEFAQWCRQYRPYAAAPADAAIADTDEPDTLAQIPVRAGSA